MTEATIKAVPEFLIEFDQSLAVIPKSKFIPTRSHPDMTPTEHILQIDRLTKEHGDYEPTVFDVSRQSKDGEVLTFCSLANLKCSEQRAIALAHILDNVHLVRILLGRYDDALRVAVGALVRIRENSIDNVMEDVAREAISEVAAIKEHPIQNEKED